MDKSKRSRYWIDSHLQCSFVTDDKGLAIALVVPPGWLNDDAPGIHTRFDGAVYVAAERFTALPATIPERQHVGSDEEAAGLGTFIDNFRQFLGQAVSA